MGHILVDSRWQQPVNAPALARSKQLAAAHTDPQVLLDAGIADAYELAQFAADDWRTRLTPRAASRTPSHLTAHRVRTQEATVRIEAAGAVVVVDPGPNCRIADGADLIVVTHAHQDHVGGLCESAAASPHARIALTPETRELLLLSPESDDVRRLIDERGSVMDANGEPMRMNDIDLRLHPAGHLLGAAMADIAFDRAQGAHLLVTGDFALRPLAELPGAVWPLAEYDTVVMECTHAWDPDAPTADPVANRRSIAAACESAAAAGARTIVVDADSLGKAQEAYVAVAEAQMRGALPNWRLEWSGKAGQVAELYRRAPHDRYSVWGPALRQTQGLDFIADRRIVFAGALRPQQIDSLQQAGVHVLRPDDLTLHASFGELFATAMALRCTRAVLYHGPVHSADAAPPLMRELQRAGRQVTTAERADAYFG